MNIKMLLIPFINILNFVIIIIIIIFFSPTKLMSYILTLYGFHIP